MNHYETSWIQTIGIPNNSFVILGCNKKEDGFPTTWTHRGCEGINFFYHRERVYWRASGHCSFFQFAHRVQNNMYDILHVTSI